ncbi:MAG: BON domain-containing protein [Anaerolineae bacterium]|nr:BON domain-containing protein [Anaerolineae bacterium]
MDWQSKLKQERAFLREQIHQADLKIRRLEGALASCHNCLEHDGLERMLRAAQVTRAVLDDLLKRQSCEDALSLESAICCMINVQKHIVARLSHGWRRGHPTPPGYWEAEQRVMFLEQLLRGVHAWETGRPLYAPGANGHIPAAAKPLPDPTHFGTVYSHPWYITGPDTRNGSATADHHDTLSQNNTVESLDALRDAIYEQLADIKFPENHLEVTLLDDGMVIVKGWAHTGAQREAAIQAIIETKDIHEELCDIEVTTPERCPICHPNSDPDSPGKSNRAKSRKSSTIKHN